MSTKTFTTTIFRDGSTCYIPLTFDPKAVFGKARGSTTFTMGGPPFVPLRRSQRRIERAVAMVVTTRTRPR